VRAPPASHMSNGLPRTQGKRHHNSSQSYSHQKASSKQQDSKLHVCWHAPQKCCCKQPHRHAPSHVALPAQLKTSAAGQPQLKAPPMTLWYARDSCWAMRSPSRRCCCCVVASMRRRMASCCSAVSRGSTCSQSWLKVSGSSVAVCTAYGLSACTSHPGTAAQRSGHHDLHSLKNVDGLWRTLLTWTLSIFPPSPILPAHGTRMSAGSSVTFACTACAAALHAIYSILAFRASMGGLRQSCSSTGRSG
jgi:hypothetical protein